MLVTALSWSLGIAVVVIVMQHLSINRRDDDTDWLKSEVDGYAEALAQNIDEYSVAMSDLESARAETVRARDQINRQADTIRELHGERDLNHLAFRKIEAEAAKLRALIKPFDRDGNGKPGGSIPKEAIQAVYDGFEQTPGEPAIIRAAEPSLDDPDNPEWTEEMFARAKPAADVLSPDVIAAFGKKGAP